MKVDTQISQEIMSLEQLWAEVHRLSNHVVEDNAKTKAANADYPIGVRRMQLVSLETLLNHISSIHQRCGSENNT